jgi:regulator of sigma E protease
MNLVDVQGVLGGSMELFFGVLVGLLILVILVVAHELGHAVVARRNGVIVEEFGIGMPPRAWKKKLKNGVLFTLNWLPLGGFVKLQGEYDSATGKGDYGAATFWQKTKILFAGVAMNWLVAIVILSVLAVTGMPKIMDDQFVVSGDTISVSSPVELVSLTEDHPAINSGLAAGDKIIKFANQDVTTVSGLIDLTKEYKGQSVEVLYSRDGSEKTVDVTLGSDASGGYFGAVLGQNEFLKSTWSAPIVGVATTAQFTWLTLQGVGDLLGNLANGLISQLNPDPSIREQASQDIKAVGDSVAGPVGILGVIFPAAEQAGFTQLMFLSAIISLSLAVMNILPIPALDGGRWSTMAIFRLLKKDLTREREEKIQMVGFSILMGLTLLVTFVDVSKLL